MQIGMTDLDTLQRFYYIVPSGNLRGPYVGQGNRKDVFMWMTMVTPAVISIWDAFRPFMSERRTEQGDSALLRRYKYEMEYKHSNQRTHVFPSYIVERYDAVPLIA